MLHDAKAIQPLQQQSWAYGEHKALTDEFCRDLQGFFFTHIANNVFAGSAFSTSGDGHFSSV